MSTPAGILLNREQCRHAAPFAVDTPDEMPRTLGSDHHHIHITGRNDRFEVNAEPVRDPEDFSGMQIGLDGLFVERTLRFVRREYVDPVRALGGLVGRHDDHAIGSRLLRTLPVGIEADDDFVSAVAKILSLGVSLASIAKDGDRLALQYLRLGIAFIKNSDHYRAPLVAQGEERNPCFWGWELVYPQRWETLTCRNRPVGRSSMMLPSPLSSCQGITQFRPQCATIPKTESVLYN